MYIAGCGPASVRRKGLDAEGNTYFSDENNLVLNVANGIINAIA